MIKQKRGMSTWIWILIALVVIGVGIGIYFLFSGGPMDPIITNSGSSIPQPPALPSG